MSVQREIRQIDFSVYSPEEVRALGATQITEHKLDIGDRHNDNLQSLYARSMGPSQNRVPCPRCLLQSPDCTGHFGYIEFPQRMSDGTDVYILHEGMLDVILALLRSVCFACSAPLLSKNELSRRGLLRLKGMKRLKAIADESIKRDMCTESDERGACGCSNPLFVAREKANYIRYHGRDEKGVKLENMPMLSSNEIRQKFTLISSEHLLLLGFAPAIRPEYMVLKNLLVLPPIARPPRVLGDQLTHNDLTILYADIIRTCNALRASADKEEENVSILYTLVSTLFNNSKGKYKYSNGRPHRTIKCALTGKGRLIRGYTQGKRVNFCIRSVASPNPNLRLSQVGIPQHLAEIVTYPEVVDVTNIKRLQRYMDEGKINQVTLAEGQYKGKVLNALLIRKEHRLQLGDVVDRWLMGRRTETDEDGRSVDMMGDIVIVNRQPTLHKMSMMGFECVIVPELTIQMPVNSAAPLGLDFDGDEL